MARSARGCVAERASYPPFDPLLNDVVGSRA
jgi:hypothetical protein